MSASRRTVFLGIDVGSTRTKVGLIADDGTPLGFGRAGHHMDSDPATGRAEQDPEAWWTGLASAARAAFEEAGAPPVAGIGIASHGPTLVAVDAGGRAVRPAITWRDSRATGEQAELEERSGVRGWSLGVLPAALWLERNEPDAAAATRWYMNGWEAIGLRLTGMAATTAVLGGGSLPVESAVASGLDPSRIAPEVPSGTVLGGLLPDAAAHLGLRAGTPVVAGLVDAFASFHGARMFGPGDGIDVGGAAGGFGVYSERPVAFEGGFTTAAPLPGLYSVGGAMAATGASLDWLAGSVLGGVPVDELISEAELVPPGADGLVFLPYLAGERSPLWDPAARGAFVGLTLRHARGHLARAVLEAAALAIRHVAAPMLRAGVDVDVMRACGGPARSTTWNQIKADVTGFPVEVPRVRDAATVGAAIVAAVGVGAHPDLRAAIGAMTAIDARFEPDPVAAAAYDGVFDAYVSLYPALRAALQGPASAAPAPAGVAA